MIIVLCACPNDTEAATIARALLEQRLVACAHIPAAGRSMYWWQDRIEDSSEVYMPLKTTQVQFEAVRDAIIAMHSYEVPCVVALPVDAGHPAFLDWVCTEARG